MREKGRDRREPIVEGEERAEYSQGAGKARCARREQQLLLKKKKVRKQALTATVNRVAREESGWRGGSQTMLWNISLTWLQGRLENWLPQPVCRIAKDI